LKQGQKEDYEQGIFKDNAIDNDVNQIARFWDVKNRLANYFHALSKKQAMQKLLISFKVWFSLLQSKFQWNEKLSTCIFNCFMFVKSNE
jgi:hypothetical protein